MCFLEVIILPFSFRHENASRYHLEKQDTSKEPGTQLVEIVKYRVTWICATYFLAYVGTEGQYLICSDLEI